MIHFLGYSRDYLNWPITQFFCLLDLSLFHRMACPKEISTRIQAKFPNPLVLEKGIRSLRGNVGSLAFAWLLTIIKLRPFLIEKHMLHASDTKK